MAMRMSPAASETLDVKPRPSPSSVAASDASTSHPRRSNPGSPSSAATVTGVVCEAAFFGSAPLSPVRSA